MLWCDRQAVALDGQRPAPARARASPATRCSSCREAAISALGLGAAGRVDDDLRQQPQRQRQRHSLRRRRRSGSSGNKLVDTRAGATARRRSASRCATGLDKNGADQCQILANQISGFAGAGIAHRRAGARPDRQAQHHRALRQRHRVDRRRAAPARCRSRTTTCATSARSRDAAAAAVVGIGVTRAGGRDDRRQHDPHPRRRRRSQSALRAAILDLRRRSAPASSGNEIDRARAARRLRRPRGRHHAARAACRLRVSATTASSATRPRRRSRATATGRRCWSSAATRRRRSRGSATSRPSGSTPTRTLVLGGGRALVTCASAGYRRTRPVAGARRLGPRQRADRPRRRAGGRSRGDQCLFSDNRVDARHERPDRGHGSPRRS